MRVGTFIKRFIVTTAGALMLVGSTTFVMAQRGEYNEYQEAVRNEQRQRLIYQRNPSRSNYNEWQDAVRDVQEEYAKYQRALRTEGNFRNVDPYGRVIVNRDPYSRGIYTNPARTGMFR